MKTSRHTFLLSGLLAALALPALADDGDHDGDDDLESPASESPDGLFAVRRGVQSPAGMLSARVTLAMNLSADLVGKPVSLAPDIYYGVNDRLQIGLVHQGPMHWQSRPGLGLCLTGEDNGCASVYDNVGFDALYGLLYGDQLNLSAHAALYLTSFDPATAYVAVGAAGKVHFGDDLALAFDPQLVFALSDRDLNDDGLFLPVELQVQVNVPTSVKLLTGISGSFSAFGDTYQVPLGIGVVRNLTEHIDLGARFSFDNLLGKTPDGVSRADTRSLALLLNLRS